MNQSELGTAVAEASGLTKTDAAKMIDAVTDAIATALKSGRDVSLGFGTLSVAEREARRGPNPRTGEAIELAASREPHFGRRRIEGLARGRHPDKVKTGWGNPVYFMKACSRWAPINQKSFRGGREATIRQLDA